MIKKSNLKGCFGHGASNEALSGLLYIEILAAEEHLDSMIEYFAKYSICRWAVHESGRKVWLRARSSDSINIVLATAASEGELQRVRLSGTSVIDIGLLVEGLDSILARACAVCESGDFVRHPRATSGQVDWATICSPVSSIVHTLIERSSYDGSMMPGWRPVRAEPPKACGVGVDDENVGLSAVDHITIVCSRGTTSAVSKWYQSVLGLKDRTGATTLQSGNGGLRLSALSSRRLDEEVYESPVTLTLVESLGRSQPGRADQVTGFLAEHGGAGVQHVAFFAPDIFATERLLRDRKVEFISAPPTYYRSPKKVQKIEAVGLSVEDLRAGQILFDGDVGRSCESDGYLLQVFTPPAFDRNTVFFELIYRGVDAEGERAEGFGAGNIRDLFRAVAESRVQGVQSQELRPTNSHQASARPDPKTQELYKRMQAECADIFATSCRSMKRESEDISCSVVIIGAGLCGLTAALALVDSGVSVTLVESRAALPLGTRAVTWVRSSLEFFDSLGIGAELSRHSVSWARGVIRRGSSSALEWRGQTSRGEHPAYSNIPQFVVHAELLKRLARSDLCAFMFNTTVTGLAGSLQPGGMVVHVEENGGDPFSMVGKYVIDSSGAHSEWRSHLAADIETSREGAFLIADLHAEGVQALPEERVFWFDAPFHDEGQTFLMLPQPGGVLRMDFGLDDGLEGGCDDKPSVLATAQERARRALAFMASDPRYAALGLDPADFRLGWSSLYRYASGVIDTAIEGRLMWMGDSLKRVSPFGARGGNEGVRDAAALAWRLALVLREGADESLLAGYSEERIYSAECDVMINRGTMRFIHPPAAMRFLREAVLEAYEGSQGDQSIGLFINTGRFPTPPPSLQGLSTFSNQEAQSGDWSDDCPRPGDYFRDGPLASGDSLFSLLPRQKFVLLVFGSEVAIDFTEMPWIQLVYVHLEGCVAPRASTDLVNTYDVRPGTCLLLRPDLFLLARWRRFDASCREFCVQIVTATQPPEVSPKVILGELSPHDAVFWVLYQALEALGSQVAKLGLVNGLLQEYAADVSECTSLEQATQELIKVLARHLAAPASEGFDLLQLRTTLARLSVG